MCGSTLEANKGWATKNIEEMLGTKIPKDTCVIIETGGCRTWRNYDISKKNISRYRIKDGKLKLLEELESASMGEASTLKDFLEYCLINYPAEKAGLIFWDHGSGSNGGVCFDTLFDYDHLSISELDEALSFLYEKGIKLDMVGFDACLMANYETVAVMSKYADHMIASEELEPGGGWDYGTVCTEYGSENFYEDMLDAYEKKCLKAKKNYYTLAHIDLSLFGELEEAFEDFCENELSRNAAVSLRNVVQYADETMCFGGNGSSECYSDLIDLAMFAENNGNKDVADSVKNMVTLVCGEDRKGASGISFYYPLANDDEISSYLAWNGKGNYGSFLERYYQREQDPGDSIVFTDRGSAREGELHFELSAGSKENIKSIAYKLYRIVPGENDSEEARCLGVDTDVIPDGENGFTTSFEGKWVMLEGNFLQCEAIDCVSSLTVYSSAAELNGEKGNIRFCFDSDSGEIRLLGFVPMEENGTQGRMLDIEAGDSLTLINEVLDTNFDRTLKRSETVIFSEASEIVVAPLPEGYYQFYAIVTDLYGNEYRSDMILSEYTEGKLHALVVTSEVEEDVGL
ncbi:MAG: hypothetical protein K6G60_06195 [Lachnospiraceae bacterium]|nr:hypothetical protein [Lachnospiraceae bacterium]